MTATNTWTIAQCDRELSDGGITTAHWRVNAEQTVGTGDDAVTYTATSYGTCGFTPDPKSGDYTPYDSVTEAEVLGWCWANGVDKDKIQTSLQTSIDTQITPTTGEGVPW
tara:strand:+ start:1324 stop:1653 length:330 start_codon:yes stop_codon:yes gene_type:complete